MESWTLPRIEELLKDHELAVALRRAVMAWGGPARSATWARRKLDRLLRGALDAVGQDLEAHRDRDRLFGLIRDDSNLADEDIGRSLELIYSHMINRFKGDLMEILSLLPMSDRLRRLQAEGRLPADAEYIWGGDISELQARRRIWAKGADALLACSGKQHARWRPETSRQDPLPGDEDLVIYGAVEIKSYSIPEHLASAQLAKHWSRLLRGVRIGRKEWNSSALFLCGLDAGELRTLPVGAPSPLLLLNFLVTPSIRDGASLAPPAVEPRLLRETVPFSRVRIMSAAYCMTEWFCGRLGERVFQATGSPWEGMTSAEAGFNRIKEALYHIQLRAYHGLEEFDRNRPKWRRRAKRLDQIASRLYNAYGWGLSAAVEHSGMMWTITDPASGEQRIETLGPAEPKPEEA